MDELAGRSGMKYCQDTWYVKERDAGLIMKGKKGIPE